MEAVGFSKNVDTLSGILFSVTFLTDVIFYTKYFQPRILIFMYTFWNLPLLVAQCHCFLVMTERLKLCDCWVIELVVDLNYHPSLAGSDALSNKRSCQITLD